MIEALPELATGLVFGALAVGATSGRGGPGSDELLRDVLSAAGRRG